MTDLVDPAEIEKIVGRKRHASFHYGRAVSKKKVFYILHSKSCLESHKDLRKCIYSKLLDEGFYADVEEDKLLILEF